MGQAAPYRRPWHATLRAAALGSASILVIAALVGDEALGAGAITEAGIQVAQGTPGASGGGRPPAGGQQRQPPQKDITDSKQTWDRKDIESAEKLSGALRDQSAAIEQLAEHFVAIGQPGMVAWAKAMLRYFDGLLNALAANATTRTFGGPVGTTQDEKTLDTTRLNQTMQRGGDAQKALDKLDQFEQSRRTATGGQTGQTPQTPNTGQTGQAPSRTATGQTAQATFPSATLIPDNPTGLPSVFQGGTVTGSPQDRLVLNPACPGELNMSLTDICARFGNCVPGANNTLSFNLNVLNQAPLFNPQLFDAPSSNPPAVQPNNFAISSDIGAFTQEDADRLRTAASSMPAREQIVQDYFNRALGSIPLGGAQPDAAANLASSLYTQQSEFLNPHKIANLAGPSVLNQAQKGAVSNIANNLFSQDPKSNPNYLTDRLTFQTSFADLVKNNIVSGNRPTGRSTSDTLTKNNIGFEWHDISPRLGLTYALGADRKTLLRASYSRFADQLGTGTSSWPNPLGGSSYHYLYFENRTPSSSSSKLATFPTSDPRGTDFFNPGSGLHRQYGNLANFPVVTDSSGGFQGTTFSYFDSMRRARLPGEGRSCGDLPTSDLMGASGWHALVPGANGVCQPIVERPIYFSGLNPVGSWSFPVGSPGTAAPTSERYRADASSFFNTGSLSHELKFGAGYREAEVASLSHWGSSYTVFDGPGGARPLDSSRPPVDARWGDYSSIALDCPPRLTLPQGWEQQNWLNIQLPHPNDPLASSRGTWRQSYDDQWWLKAINWIKADNTSVLPEQAQPVTVAVIDTGLDLRHPELFGAVWVNPNEPLQGPPGMWRNPRKMRSFGWNFVNNSPDLRDFNGHGTVVAGIIAANVNNGVGIAGINPWAKIMPLKVADHRGRASTFHVAKAIVFAADNGARVVNVSLGANLLSEVVKRAIDYAAKKNVLIVVSAGNAGVDVKDFTPSAFANTIAVAAVDANIKRAGFSNFGDNVTISAPGVDILSLRAGGTDLMRFVRADYQPGSAVVNERYYRVDGTSFAAPMVTGVASLILSLRPELTAAQVKRMILQSARDISGAGRDRNLGYGLLDAEAALKADPAFFVDGVITGLSVVQASGRQAVRVVGTANADKMKRAWIEIGQGETPSEWKKVSDNVTRSVENGVIGDIETRNLAGAKVWTVRVVVEHQNGRTREGRYVLRLG